MFPSGLVREIAIGVPKAENALLVTYLAFCGDDKRQTSNKTWIKSMVVYGVTQSYLSVCLMQTRYRAFAR
jgi:hypothetical protein